WEATALYLISGCYDYLRDKQKTFEFADRAVQVARANPPAADADERRLGVKVQANALDTLGWAHLEFGDKQKALAFFEQALQFRQSISDRVGEAITLNHIATAHVYMGDYRKGLDFLNRASSVVGELGDLRKEASLLNNLCTTSSDVGEYRKAIEFCNQ